MKRIGVLFGQERSFPYALVARINELGANEIIGADRQLAVYKASGGDLRRVVDFICEETIHGLDIAGPLRRSAHRAPPRPELMDTAAA